MPNGNFAAKLPRWNLYNKKTENQPNIHINPLLFKVFRTKNTPTN